MNPNKEWVMRVTWKVPGDLITKWQGIVRYWMRQRNLKWNYYMHYQITWAWYTMSRYVIPIGKHGEICVDLYWHLTPEQGWLSTYAVGIQYVSNLESKYRTELDPATADSIIHGHYFNCFKERAIQQALRGHRFVFCQFPEGHKSTGQVPSLQYLALLAHQNGLRERSKRGKTRRSRNLGSKQGAVGQMAKRYVTRSQPGGEAAFWERTPVPSMELLSGGRRKTWYSHDGKGLQIL
uniref:Virion infectivity factor n=1 Tax=Simian immunodeficiency virus agm.vervet (isolate AGM TYO-1) TaxID=11731 RepID=VIF_SIVVT|nr:RecName: Full=Virion infectivity factor; Short=Vif; AltName: Full=Q protein; AltName: Full=SOR protein [Simian immunodeficiency virus (TYO-1 ISOLATE)]pir/ASLJG4/ vif protein - simian immunodeficiency virus (African green monkey isolate) [Simian immunodeficiency virus]CAA30659.1 sor (Q orf) [Simian immunodeficiency virus]